MKRRDLYLNQLIALKDKSLIKVITGVRRCGKSSLLDLFAEYLLSVDVDPKSIIRVNFESGPPLQVVVWNRPYKGRIHAHLKVA